MSTNINNFSVIDAITPCRACGSAQISLVKMPNYSAHYAARRCGRCDVFMGWEPRPANKEKWQQRQVTVTALLNSSQLSQWEREFLASLQGKRSLSPKQEEVLSRIEAKVGGQQ